MCDTPAARLAAVAVLVADTPVQLVRTPVLLEHVVGDAIGLSSRVVPVNFDELVVHRVERDGELLDPAHRLANLVGPVTFEPGTDEGRVGREDTVDEAVVTVVGDPRVQKDEIPQRLPVLELLYT